MADSVPINETIPSVIIAHDQDPSQVFLGSDSGGGAISIVVAVDQEPPGVYPQPDVVVTPGTDGTPYILPVATPTILGGIKVGEGLAITADGILSVTVGSAYVLPVATSTVLGGVKIGTGLSITADGVLSASAGASYSVLNGLSPNAADATIFQLGGDLTEAMTKLQMTGAQYLRFESTDNNSYFSMLDDGSGNAEFALNSAYGTNMGAFVVDQNGVALQGSDGTTTSYVLVSKDGLRVQDGRLRVDHMATGLTAPTVTGTPKMVVTDSNGDFSFTNMPAAEVVYSVENGLSPKSGASNVFQLGGTLSQNTVITGLAYTLTVTGTNSGGVFIVNGTNGAGVSATIVASATAGSAFSGNSSTGYGGSFSSTSGYGIQAISTSGPGAKIVSQPTSANTIVTALEVHRYTSGTAASGLGAAIDYYLECDNGSILLANRLVSKWTNAGVTTSAATLEFWGKYNGSFKKAELDSASGFTVYSSQTQATTTAELNATPNGWTVGGGFVSSGSGRYTIPTASTSGTISFDFGALTIGDVYIVAYSAPNGLANSTLTFAGFTSPGVNPNGGTSQDWRYHHIKATSTSGVLTISSSTSAGTAGAYIENITVRKLTGATPIAYAQNTENGANGFELRSDAKTHNLGIGFNAGRYGFNQQTALSATYGSRNIAIGDEALANPTVATDNIGIGYKALTALTDGTRNTIIGSLSGAAITTGWENTALGYNALPSMTTGKDNTAIGANTLTTNTTGSANTAVGKRSLGNVQGSNNTGIGYNAIGNGTATDYNTAIGASVGQSVSTGGFNTLIGAFAGNAITTGSNNVTLGYNTLSTVGTGVYNIAIGGSSGSVVTSQAYELSMNRLHSGDSYMLFIGQNSTKDLATNISSTNSIAIGVDSRVYQDNQVVLGGNSVTSTYLKGKVEVRDFSGLAANNLADNTFPTGTTKWAVTGGASLGTNKAVIDLNVNTTSTLTQTLSNLAIPGKGGRWYKVTVNSNQSPVLPGSFYSSFTIQLTGSTFANQVRTVRDSSFNGTTSFFGYFFSTASPTDVTFTITGTKGSGDGILNITNIQIQEVIGGDVFINRNLEVYNGIITLTKSYTPTSSSDSTYPVGTICSDDNYIYKRRSDGTWAKAALVSV